MWEVTRAGKGEEGSWLDIAERPFGLDVGILIVRRMWVPDILATHYEKKGPVRDYADIRPDFFKTIW